MYKIIMAVFISFGAVSYLGASTALECDDVADMDADTLESCVKQADDSLNKYYQQIVTERKDSPEQVDLLKNMQLGWIKQRDAQCELAMRNTASNAALVGLACEVVLTQNRAVELQKMAEDSEFF